MNNPDMYRLSNDNASSRSFRLQFNGLAYNTCGYFVVDRS